MLKPLASLFQIFDTNTILSATLKPFSVPGRALERAMTEGLLTFSTETLDELKLVFSRPKFDRWVSLEERHAAISKIILASQIVPVANQVTLCRDPKDDKFLSLAQATTATYLVTGDQDLLMLDPFHTTRILTPRDYLDL